MSTDDQPDYREPQPKPKPNRMPPGLEAKSDAPVDHELKAWIETLKQKLFGRD